jgi:hypothetical protein
MGKTTRQARAELEAHRLDGRIRSLGCEGCPLLDPCGGQTRTAGGWGCLSGCTGCNPKTCDVVCFGKAREFAEAFREVGGFGHDDIGSLASPDGKLPRYIPVVQHPYEKSRRHLLRWSWVALPLSSLLRHTEGTVGLVAHTEEELRQVFQIHPKARIVLLGTGPDEPIEEYWAFRRLLGLREELGRLGFAAAIAPNYSLFLDDPRPHHLYNRKRGLICAHEFSRRGVPTIPYLHGVCPQDYEFWQGFLSCHSEVHYVAKEFQTGLARPERGAGALEQVARLQDLLKRPLHLVAIGAPQYRGSIANRFDNWTIMDSMPFMKAVHRRRALLGSQRVHWRPVRRKWIDGLLLHDIGLYSRWIGSPSGIVPVSRVVPRTHNSAIIDKRQVCLPYGDDLRTSQ